MKALWCVVLLFFLMSSGKGQAQDLNFEEILKQALLHSYDLRIVSIEKQIGEEKLIEAGGMYFPSLSLRFNTEYMADLGKDRINTVSVGETIIPGNDSTFQHSMALSAQYLLYDFGMRSLKYRNAGRNIRLAEYTSAQRRIDVKAEVLSLFGSGLRIQKKIDTWNAVLDLRKEVYQLTRRLVMSGNKDKPELGITAIGVAEALQNCEAFRLDMTGIIEKLACYTDENYSGSAVRFMDFPEPAKAVTATDVATLPGVRAYDVAIEQKTTEVDIACRHWAPTLSFYASYRMYGNDRSSFAGSLENLEEKNAAIGLVLSMNLFNGFSDMAKARRIKKELEKLKIEKEKLVADEKQKIRTLIQKNILSEQEFQSASTYQAALNDQESMIERLSLQQIIDRVSFLQHKGTQMEKQLTLALANVERCMNFLQLQMMAEEAF